MVKLGLHESGCFEHRYRCWNSFVSIYPFPFPYLTPSFG